MKTYKGIILYLGDVMAEEMTMLFGFIREHQLPTCLLPDMAQKDYKPLIRQYHIPSDHIICGFHPVKRRMEPKPLVNQMFEAQGQLDLDAEEILVVAQRPEVVAAAHEAGIEAVYSKPEEISPLLDTDSTRPTLPQIDFDRWTVPTRGIIGTICGDIIGSAYESRKIDNVPYDFDMFPKKAHFSDDTLLTLAISKWLQRERTTENLQRQLVHMGLRYPKGGWGHKFKAWLLNKDRKPYWANSNGAAMRVGAIGWVANSLDEALELAKQSAAISHNSEEAIRGAQSVVACIYLTRTGKSKAEIKQYIEQTFGYNLSRRIVDIRPAAFETACDICVPQAITAWLESDSFEEAVRKAVWLSADTDTQAAITGSIAAATPGMEVPQEIAKKAFSYLNNELKTLLYQFEEYLH